MADDTVIEVEYRGERVLVDPLDITGMEWRAIKRHLDLKPKRVLTDVEELDFDAIAALVWVVLRRDDPDCSYDDILESLSLRSFADEDEDEDEGSSGEGDDGADADPSG